MSKTIKQKHSEFCEVFMSMNALSSIFSAFIHFYLLLYINLHCLQHIHLLVLLVSYNPLGAQTYIRAICYKPMSMTSTICLSLYKNYRLIPLSGFTFMFLQCLIMSFAVPHKDSQLTGINYLYVL